MVEGGLELFVHYIIPTQRGSLDELAWFPTEKHDISLNDKLAILMEFVVDSGTARCTSGNLGTEVCKGWYS